VGKNGTFLAWDGQVWTDLSLSVSDQFFTVDCLINESNCVTAGTTGGIGGFLNGDGKTWDGIKKGKLFGGVVTSIKLVSQQEAWAVGNIGMIGGTILHWDGIDWTNYEGLKIEDLNDLSILNANQGWAVGDTGTLLHWDGTTWMTELTGVEEDLFTIFMLSDQEGWIAGENGLLLRRQREEWQVFPSSNERTLNALEMISSNEGWAVGDGGVIMFWDGTNWVIISQPEMNDLRSVSISPGSQGMDGWAVGNSQTMFHWNGMKWERVQGPTNNLHTVEMLSTDDGWIEGYYYDKTQRTLAFYHWNGQDWQSVIHPGPDPVSDMAFSSSNDGWAVGANGTVYLWDGIQWLSAASPTDNSLLGVVSLAADDVWATGAYGTIIHWDGRSWKTVESASDNYLEAIGFASPSLGWAMGSLVQSVQWDGVRWAHFSQLPVSVQDLAILSAQEGWGVGYSGDIIHWDGSQWQITQSPTRNNLTTVSFAASEDGWAGGENGVILRYSSIVAPPGSAIGIPTPTTQEQPAVEVTPYITTEPAIAATPEMLPPVAATASGTNESESDQSPKKNLCAAPAILLAAPLALVLWYRKYSRPRS
jgi:photosystem II stability/assembly factor-like uncharacterized protein